MRLYVDSKGKTVGGREPWHEAKGKGAAKGWKKGSTEESGKSSEKGWPAAKGKGAAKGSSDSDDSLSDVDISYMRVSESAALCATSPTERDVCCAVLGWGSLLGVGPGRSNVTLTAGWVFQVTT